MTVRVELRVRSPRIDAAALRDAAERLSALAAPLARRRGAPDFASLEVLLVGERASAAAHRAANGAEGATDVITLPYAATPLAPARAELVACPAVALRAAAARDPATLLPEERRLAWSADLELALYLAHGLDHLAGSSDATAAGYRAMRLRELRWLAALGPAPRLFR
jgi:ssRNA-specific RNase YbeY (16S rRNA maturation enzyme)